MQNIKSANIKTKKNNNNRRVFNARANFITDHKSTGRTKIYFIFVLEIIST